MSSHHKTAETKMQHFWQDIDGWSNQVDQGALIRYVLDHLDDKKPLKICEIGVFCGRLTALWNVELINRGVEYTYMAVDHFEGSADMDKSRDYHTETLNNLKPIIDKVTIIKNNSEAEARNHPDESFDLVYIDASHDYDSVLRDIIAWLPKVRVGGYLAGDDYIDGHPGVKRAVDHVFQFEKVTIIGYQQWLFHRYC